ncbi:MAG: 50S ribosome-binding GTPase [Iphinoe sp. HA4291-MV1]|jgi:GTPase SAR1 family protein|nr:50S ribosome-binding GTPase [Iphinoe sp. HA4291-MV1]
MIGVMEVTAVLVGVLIAVGGYIKAKLDNLKEQEKIKIKTEQETLNSLYKPEKTNEGEKRNAIIIVGIGGCGKTTLINKLFDERANSRIPTHTFQRYSSYSEEYNSIKYNYHIADYKGQNIGSLITNLLDEQKQPNSPLTLVAINSIIFMVDVAKPSDPEAVAGVANPTNFSNEWHERVRKHIREWSPTALDAIFGLVTKDSLKCVCLFINKQDLLPNINIDDIRQEYKELIKNIRERSESVGIELKILYGSALEDWKLLELKNYLRKNSVLGYYNQNNASK